MKKKNSKLWEFQQNIKDSPLECPRCHKVTYLTVDHIIPVSFLQQVGLFELTYSDEENFEAICKTCNLYKASRFDMANPKTLPLLRKYVAML